MHGLCEWIIKLCMIYKPRAPFSFILEDLGNMKVFNE